MPAYQITTQNHSYKYVTVFANRSTKLAPTIPSTPVLVASTTGIGNLLLIRIMLLLFLHVALGASGSEYLGKLRILLQKSQVSLHRPGNLRNIERILLPPRNLA